MNYIKQHIKKLRYTVFFKRFRHCGFHAVIYTQIKGLNRDKSVCLRTKRRSCQLRIDCLIEDE